MLVCILLFLNKVVLNLNLNEGCLTTESVVVVLAGNAVLCGRLCLELLRCCNSRLSAIRQESCAILYLLMRSNFEFSNRKGLTRVHLQVTEPQLCTIWTPPFTLVWLSKKLYVLMNVSVLSTNKRKNNMLFVQGVPGSDNVAEQ
jgi:hypothetical protein